MTEYEMIIIIKKDGNASFSEEVKFDDNDKKITRKELSDGACKALNSMVSDYFFSEVE